MFRDHPTISIKITEDIIGTLTQLQRGITYLTFTDAKGYDLPVPPGLKCYDKTVGPFKGDLLGVEMDIDPYGIPLCTTNWYEIYWNGKLTTELNFTCYITSHNEAA